MTLTCTIKPSDCPTRIIKAVQPIQKQFRAKPRDKGLYRINIWGPEFGKQKKSQYHLPFVPCGKVSNDTWGTFRWLRMRNGKMYVSEDGRKTGWR